MIVPASNLSWGPFSFSFFNSCCLYVFLCEHVGFLHALQFPLIVHKHALLTRVSPVMWGCVRGGFR